VSEEPTHPQLVGVSPSGFSPFERETRCVQLPLSGSGGCSPPTALA
jgi:hypothetical protein